MIDGTLALHLENCSASTRLGMVDRGAPQHYAKLAAMGYVAPLDGGYRTTTEGENMLRDLRRAERLNRERKYDRDYFNNNF